MVESNRTEIAVFGGGCFWCTEAMFSALRGVLSAMPGYSGGIKPNPSYEQVGGGKTGHAEVIKIEFDSDVIKFADLLEIFFATHDPTTMNRPEGDVGEQYRSVIFYADLDQEKAAIKLIAKLNKSGNFTSVIVTQVVPLEKFYGAEDYHHNYFAKNPEWAYCQAVINPKMEKFRAKYGRVLK
ncbi:TPA: peptide-methionine (S)-S-oxide reductase [Patescibacteria group bacterium]|nr:peptide-methionine (S)-S-oxide reductase [Patescibacteria group bacterium]